MRSELGGIRGWIASWLASLILFIAHSCAFVYRTATESKIGWNGKWYSVVTPLHTPQWKSCAARYFPIFVLPYHFWLINNKRRSSSSAVPGIYMYEQSRENMRKSVRNTYDIHNKRAYIGAYSKCFQSKHNDSSKITETVVTFWHSSYHQIKRARSPRVCIGVLLLSSYTALTLYIRGGFSISVHQKERLVFTSILSLSFKACAQCP